MMTHDERSAIQDAYGMLWLVVTNDRRIHEARKRLLSLIDKDGQGRGIQVAKNIFGPTTEAEIVNIDAPAPQPHVAGEPHLDDLAVDRFAVAMKAKLAQKRAEGRGGWNNPDECSIEWLSELLRSHVEKADPVDVGNFAMMIHQRGGRICK